MMRFAEGPFKSRTRRRQSGRRVEAAWFGGARRRKRRREFWICPSCRGGLAAEERLLQCGSCGWTIPVVDGFVMVTEGFDGTAKEERLAEIEARCFGDAADYAEFVRRKGRRPSFDAYAAFQPFNDA